MDNISVGYVKNQMNCQNFIASVNKDLPCLPLWRHELKWFSYYKKYYWVYIVDSQILALYHNTSKHYIDMFTFYTRNTYKLMKHWRFKWSEYFVHPSS